MIEIKNLKKYFPIKGGFLNSKKGDVKAVENITFKIPEGEILLGLLMILVHQFQFPYKL